MVEPLEWGGFSKQIVTRRTDRFKLIPSEIILKNESNLEFANVKRRSVYLSVCFSADPPPSPPPDDGDRKEAASSWGQ